MIYLGQIKTTTLNGEKKMQEIKIGLVIYYLQTRTPSFAEALRLAENFMRGA